MRLTWHVTASDAGRIKRLLSDSRSHPLVRARRERNLAAQRPRVRLPGFWHALCGALLTTQQRSGPKSPVTRFLAARPFPLSYARVSAARDIAKYVTGELTRFGGIRRSTNIGAELVANHEKLSAGHWKQLDQMLARLSSSVNAALEREVANVLDDSLMGIGPKQSRNLLQGLGLTRYEIPLDSRLTKWLNEFGFPLQLNATALSDRHYYEFVSDGVQALCGAAKVAPCLFDAAVFASFDTDEWSDPVTFEWGYSGD